MAQVKKKQKAAANKQPVRQGGRKIAVPAASSPLGKYYLPLFIVLAVSFIAYLPALGNGFVWDDEFYIVNNRLIQGINLKELFSQYVMGNYHPLTMLSYALEYHFYGISEKGYHTVN